MSRLRQTMKPMSLSFSGLAPMVFGILLAKKYQKVLVHHLTGKEVKIYVDETEKEGQGFYSD